MRWFLRVWLWVVVLVAGCAVARAGAQMQAVGDGGPGPVKAQHLTAELTTASGAVRPGGSVSAGLVLTLEDRWHVYWINAGDAGEPPHIAWTLPAGVTATAMQFPIPMRLPLGPLMDFGYEEKAAFPFQVQVAKTVRPGPVHLAALVTWIVCREVCVPGKAKLGIDLKVDPAAPAGTAETVGAIGEARSLLPKPLPAGDTVTVTGGAKDFVVTYKGAQSPDDAEIYPFRDDLILNAPDQGIDVMPGGIRVRVQRSPELKALPKDFHALLRFSDDEAYEFTAPVVPGEVPEPAGAAGPKAANGAAASGVTLWGALGLAFVGGVILNLMPCVFPVLFLKGLTLLQSSGEETRRLRAHGLVYTLGILVSFWAIVAVLLGLRSSSNQIGWGFQLQSPVFLAVLALGLFFFSLSLAGQFDLGLSMTSAGDRLTRKEGYAGSFFTGVLAVVVATPCTAPLMGAAIGFALAQPAGVTWAIFTVLALGLATPYLLLTLQPAWMRWLPRPGAWMETLKQLTAVPLFATVIWLVWVYGQLFSGGQAGAQVDHVAKLLIGFLLLAMAGWALGRWPARRGSTVAAVVLGACAVAVPLVQAKESTAVAWQPYTKAALEEARAAGKPVFLDFTAAWCLSCQVNERVVLRSAEVQREFAEHGVALMRADWTQYDPTITAELGKVGRSGVPTYVLYPGGTAKAPDVLPELLSKPAVLDALKKDLK